jgi:hypothetical protein
LLPVTDFEVVKVKGVPHFQHIEAFTAIFTDPFKFSLADGQ